MLYENTDNFSERLTNAKVILGGNIKVYYIIKTYVILMFLKEL